MTTGALAGHVTCRILLRDNAEAMENFRTNQGLRFILREERTFVEGVQRKLNRPPVRNGDQ